MKIRFSYNEKDTQLVEDQSQEKKEKQSTQTQKRDPLTQKRKAKKSVECLPRFKALLFLSLFY